MIGIKTVSDLQHELSCFSGGTPVFVTVCPINGEAQEIKDIYVDGVGVMIEVNAKEEVKDNDNK